MRWEQLLGITIEVNRELLTEGAVVYFEFSDLFVTWLIWNLR